MDIKLYGIEFFKEQTRKEADANPIRMRTETMEEIHKLNEIIGLAENSLMSGMTNVPETYMRGRLQRP